MWAAPARHRRGDLPCTPDLTALTLTERAPLLRELERLAVKDKTYQRHPIGQQAGRFLRSLRWADNTGKQNTINSYEDVLQKLALEYADFDGIHQFCDPGGSDLIREFLDKRWGTAAVATRAHHLAVIKSFFKWAVGERIIPYNPIAEMKPPRVRNRERNAYDRDTRLRLFTAQPALRDQCALQLLGRMGLRKEELRLTQIRDVDLTRNLLTVHGKGGKVVILPLAFESLRDDLYLHFLAEERQPDEYLLYPNQDRERPMDMSTVHRWFKRCLGQAGLPNTMEMHELRHSAADELWRVTGNIVLAQQLLRHESVGTTQLYLHPTREDLAAGMELVEAEWA